MRTDYGIQIGRFHGKWLPTCVPGNLPGEESHVYFQAIFPHGFGKWTD